MRQTLIFVLIAAFFVNPLAYGQTDPLSQAIDEWADPTCVQPDEKLPIKKYTTFVNGLRFFDKGEIRVLKQGNLFNYEICFDISGSTDLSKGFPSEFPVKQGQPNPCVLASNTWIHIKGADIFKAALKAALEDDLKMLQTRKRNTEFTAKFLPVLKKFIWFYDHAAEVTFPAAIFSLWYTGYLKVLMEKSMVARITNGVVRTSKALAIFYALGLGLKFFSDDDHAEVEVKNEKGEVVTGTTLAAKEIEDAFREIAGEADLTPEDGPLLLQFVFGQLQRAIPEAMARTSERLGCIDRS